MSHPPVYATSTLQHFREGGALDNQAMEKMTGRLAIYVSSGASGHCGASSEHMVLQSAMVW